MPDLNRANRQVCDLDIRILKTMVPFLFFDTANVTTVGLTGDAVYAMAKGRRRISFPNPMQGTLTVEAQVYPFKFFSLFSNGKVLDNATYAEKRTVKCTTDGELSLSITGASIVGTPCVFPEGEFGDEDKMVAGTFSSGKFTATDPDDIVANENYEVGFVVSRSSGVKRVEFKDDNLPADYFITMKTVDKDDVGAFTPFVITAYKAAIQRNFELSFNSEGDPASITATFDLMEDKDHNMLDMVEIIDDIQLS